MRADWDAPPGIRAARFRVGIDEFALISFDWVRSGDGRNEVEMLSPSEREVAELAWQGHSNAVIARIRSTSVRTVENQISGIYRRLNLGSRRELMRLASRMSKA
jgi:DNA-binding NarL/FixJ family response regulator